MSVAQVQVNMFLKPWQVVLSKHSLADVQHVFLNMCLMILYSLCWLKSVGHRFLERLKTIPFLETSHCLQHRASAVDHINIIMLVLITSHIQGEGYLLLYLFSQP